MPDPQLLMPDAELVLIDFLIGHASLTPFLGPGKVGSFLSDDRPFAQVNRIGGRPDGQGEDNPQLQVAVWADTDALAATIARTIGQVLPEIISDTVRGQEILLGPLSQPDQDNHRYILTVELLTYA